MRIEHAVASRTCPGHDESGDLHVACHFPEGLLLGVVDGLGHGAAAAEAARVCASILEAHPHEPVMSLLTRCHAALRGTRGAAMTLTSFSLESCVMTWTGIGNVEGILLRADPRAVPRHESLLRRAGVAGDWMPRPHGATTAVSPGDTVILATDGIRLDFSRAIEAGESPQRIADRILREFSRVNDDALVLAARVLEGEG